MQQFLYLVTRPYYIRRIREVVDFVVVFGGIFVCGVVFLNYQSIYNELQYTFTPAEEHRVLELDQVLATTASVRGQGVQHMDEVVLTHTLADTVSTIHDYDLATYLTSRSDAYNLTFNRMPPTNYLRIPSLGVSVPIVEAPYKTEEALLNADFEDELYEGVVHYPRTRKPGDDALGSALIFGHSSSDPWRDSDNLYGYVFQHLPKLKHGDEIEVVWDGELHTYTMDKTAIKGPREVSKELASYDDKRYLALMACYPLGSDKYRYIVRAVEKTM